MTVYYRKRMFSATLTDEQQRHVAKSVTNLLSLYKHISDSYIIEFFSENLWESLPLSWQEPLNQLSPPQIADLLLDKSVTNRGYPSVWPLSLLAFRASAHALAYPRVPPDQGSIHPGIKPEEFHSNQSQSSLLGHIFRKHVKPKKQHEIRRLGMMVTNLCQQTNCDDVVDVGSGQGHLTRFLSFGLGLSVTAIEADANLVSMAKKFDGQLRSTLEKERLRKTDANHLPQVVSGPSPHHVVGWVNPKASWEDFIEQLNSRDDESEWPVSAGGLCKKRQWISMSASDHQPDSKGQCLRSAECDSPSCAEGSRARALSLHQVTDCPGPILEDLQAHDCSSDSAPAADVKHTQTPLVKRPCRSSPVVCSGQSASCLFNSTLSDSTAGPGDEERMGRGFVLTGLHACGDLSATLLRHFVSCPRVQGITSVACCYMKITTKENPSPPGVLAPPPTAQSADALTPSDFGYPMSEWVRGLPGHQLSYKAREGACHAVEDYVHRLREESELLKTHCYRAVLETVIRASRPDVRRAGIQTIKKAHTLPFAEYARLGLPRVGLPADLPLDQARVDTMLQQQGRVVTYFSLVLLLAPVVETLVLLDRMLFLQEQGIPSQLVPLFDPAFSPRNLVLVAVKQGLTQGVKDAC
ncbi:protein RRNAD1 isoform X2 [Alosa sapidissima]|uniref:protein RRNAD1 isoform X2 n=1 Tax=Alosa sapidissima TaxID=34773 RepID=UPI001C0929AC|nr:protein RRNAD1 isoform X2 [Alosa sapidissima]